MNLSDSDDEFFDAIDDSIPPPHPSELNSLQSTKTSASLHPRKEPSTCCLKPPEMSFTELCTSSSQLLETGCSGNRMLPFATGLVPVDVHVNKKDYREFDGLKWAQEVICCPDCGVVRTKFSPDGRFLCVSCESGVIHLYEVTRERSVERGFPLLKPQPYQTFQEHIGPVVDLAWEHSSTYLLSASLDALVLLWRVDSPTSLFRFPHPASVTSVSFHPLTPSLFATGSLDSTLRLWSTQEQKEVQHYSCGDHITALAFSPKGRELYVGIRLGQVLVLNIGNEGQSMTEAVRLSCRNRRGFKSGGRKVTGIEFFDENCREFSDDNCLISTNDSRARLFVNKEMTQKYKGHKSEEHTIRLSFSHNSLHVISGSENGIVYIWNLHNSYVPNINPK